MSAMTEKKKQLIREAIWWQIAKAEREIERNAEAHDLAGHQLMREIRCILHHTQSAAAEMAVDAATCDTRVVHSIEQIDNN